MSGAGYGAGPWGGVSWGGAIELEFVPPTDCDLFLFEHCTSMLDILVSPIIEIAGDPIQFAINYPDPPSPPTTCDLGLLSGDLSNPLFSENNAYIVALPPAGIDGTHTLEVTVLQEELPNDFADIINRHFFFGVTDRTGPCSGIFVSKAGFSYAGAIHHIPGAPASGDLVLDSSFQVIPGTSPKVLIGEYVTYRLAVSGSTGAVYFYATRTTELPVTGHQLVAVLPVIDASDLTYVPTEDRAILSVRGTNSKPTRVALDRWCLSSSLVIPNVLPVANAGQDQALRLCSIAQLDGSASFDPEGASLLYEWRLIDAPGSSEFAKELYDGRTYALLIPTGYTSKLHSVGLANVDALDPVQVDDVITIGGESYSIVSKGVDVNGFYVQFSLPYLADSLVAEPFKLLRQRGISNRDSVIATFYPDVAGFYKFDLVVFDGSLYSDPSITILNVLESSLPRGCTPDLKFVNSLLSDFWSLVEDAEVVESIWSSLAQTTATELYTLWQYEYSKSLRDIQRTIVRRWLHYDSLLAEPVPELTKIRTLWSGIESSQIPIIGDPAIPYTSLVLSSPAFAEDIVIDLLQAELPAQVAELLSNKLAGIDSRFSVELIPENTASPSFYIIRIDAPFRFEVGTGTTVPIFAIGAASGVVEGSGAAVGVKTYMVDRSLVGLPIAENDLLVLDGIGYRIVRVIDGLYTDPDTYPGQRLVLKDDPPVPAPTEWKIGSHVTSELLDFYNGLVAADDDVFFEIGGIEDDVSLTKAKVLGVCASLTGVMAFDATPLSESLANESVVVRLAKVNRGGYLPISDLVKDVPILQEFVVISDEEAVLHRNVDFFIEEYRGLTSLRFDREVWEGETPPDRLWAEYTYVDNNPTIEANFGIPADFTLDELQNLPESVDYLSAVRGLWYAYFNGPTMLNMRVGAQIFLGLPFAEVAGTIEEIRTDYSPNEGRILVRDTASVEIVRTYKFPNQLGLEVNPNTGEKYKVGDSVAQFAPLVEGVSVVDYKKDPEWFRGLLNQGMFYEVQKYHTFTVQISSEIFSLPTLSLVQDFILKIRPQYQYPIFVITFSPSATDIDVTDEIEYNGTLHLFDDVCGNHGASMFDDPRSGGSDTGWWNQFDTDDDPITPPPVFPTPDAVKWGYDKGYLCPVDTLTADMSTYFDGVTPVSYDSIFAFDTPVTYISESVDTGPFAIPALPGEYVLPGTVTAPLGGEIKEVRVLIIGGPGSDPIDYELVLTVDGVDTEILPVDVDETIVEARLDVSGNLVTTGQVIGFKLRIRTGSASPGARNPPWTYVRAQGFVDDGLWAVDDPPEDPSSVHIPPAGTYVRRGMELA